MYAITPMLHKSACLVYLPFNTSGAIVYLYNMKNEIVAVMSDVQKSCSAFRTQIKITNLRHGKNVNMLNVHRSNTIGTLILIFRIKLFTQTKINQLHFGTGIIINEQNVFIFQIAMQSGAEMSKQIIEKNIIPVPGVKTHTRTETYIFLECI